MAAAEVDPPSLDEPLKYMDKVYAWPEPHSNRATTLMSVDMICVAADCPYVCPLVHRAKNTLILSTMTITSFMQPLRPQASGPWLPHTAPPPCFDVQLPSILDCRPDSRIGNTISQFDAGTIVRVRSWWSREWLLLRRRHCRQTTRTPLQILLEWH